MPGILTPLGNPEAEADVIVTSVILGFSLTRVVQGEPFTFDIEPYETRDRKGRSEYQADAIKHGAVVDAIKRVLRRQNVRGVEKLSVQVSDARAGVGRALITGRSSGHHLAPRGMGGDGGRHRDMRDLSANQMRVWEWLSGVEQAQRHEQFRTAQGQYHGRGAYTGMIDDPIGSHTLIQPTLRRVILDPQRWSNRPDGIWGLIADDGTGNSPNLDPNPNVGMGPLVLRGRSGGVPRRGIVQYTHGMSWAMRDAVRWGPWCNAYELAVGEHTTKLASCFPCTTYMYAAGFPPASCHIGRGESWAPLPDGSLQARGGREDHEFSSGAEGAIEKAIALSINVRWHSQIYHYLRKGAEMLRGYGGMQTSRRTACEALCGRLSRVDAAQVLHGGNLFLDALTWHKGDADRLRDTLLGG